jgi:hypothetical protein
MLLLLLVHQLLMYQTRDKGTVEAGTDSNWTFPKLHCLVAAVDESEFWRSARSRPQ